MTNPNFFIWVLKHRKIDEIASRVGELCIGYLLYPFSFLTPRNKKKWLIGNKTGYCDNSKYLFLSLHEHSNDGIRTIWISRNKVDKQYLKALGFEVFMKWSLKGLYHELTAGAYLFSSNVSDINYWTSGRAVKINMWHGVGIKKLGMKGSDVYNPNSRFNRLMTPYNYDKPSVFITTSKLMDKHFSDCYLLSEGQTKRIGYPRCDFMMQDKRRIQRHIELYESKAVLSLISTMKSYKRVFIYMPTFRDDQTDFMQLSGIDLDDLNTILVKTNALLLVKMHPATRLDTEVIRTCSNIILMDKKMDVYPVLPFTDVLITDYSSIYYDYILLNDKRVILFPFDYENYISNSRDLAYDYSEYTPGKKITNYLDFKEAVWAGGYEIERKDWTIKQFWGDNYLNASEKIISLTKCMLN